jgi:hypothetical protein
MKKRQHHQISVPPAMLDRNASLGGTASTTKRQALVPGGFSLAESGDIISISSPPLNMEVPLAGTIESLNTPNG